MFIQVIIVFLFAWMFDQNIGTHGPICLKFRLGNSEFVKILS